MKSFNYGLKLHSINYNSFMKAIKLLELKIFSYIELYVVPTNLDFSKLEVLKGYKIILHAPNYNHYFNIIEKDKVYKKSIDSVSKLADFLNCYHTIFHPGIISKDRRQNANQILIERLSDIKSKGLNPILENVPALGLDAKTKLVASKFSEFREIIEEASVLSCIDIAHTIASANYHKEDILKYINHFLNLNPYIVHICDGDRNSIIDNHMNIGDGNFPLKEIFNLIPTDQRISIETPKNDFKNLTDDVRNLEYIELIIKKLKKNRLE